MQKILDTLSVLRGRGSVGGSGGGGGVTDDCNGSFGMIRETSGLKQNDKQRRNMNATEKHECSKTRNESKGKITITRWQ